MKIYTVPRKAIHDSRGWFLKIADGNEPGNPFPCEVYFTSAKPGESKGSHYHRLANEWFTLISGEAMLRLHDIVSGESASMQLTAGDPVTVFVPAGIAHLFQNTGNSEFLVAAYTDRQYDPADTIPYDFNEGNHPGH